jgi:hypothetical protein
MRRLLTGLGILAVIAAIIALVPFLVRKYLERRSTTQQSSVSS